ncbi:MAG: carbohydrate porin [Candidatus Brocadiales bacterium]|nr:carbohydrate porin [Candidatus Bathyanammoxibius amoris]
MSYVFCCAICSLVFAEAALAINSDEKQLRDMMNQVEYLKARMVENEEKIAILESELKEFRGPVPVSESFEVAEEPLHPQKKERLEERVKRLEDVAEKTFALEPIGEIRRVREWVCPDGHIYDHPSPDYRCYICDKPQRERFTYRRHKYARKQTVSGLIGTMMEEELKKRVSVGLSTTGVVQQSVNSHKNDETSAEGSFDLFFLHRPMTGSILFVNLESIGGSGPNIFSRTPNNMNDDVSRGSHQDEDGLDRVSVREVWLQSTFMEERLRLVAGKIDLSNYFDMNAVANDETTQFLGSTFVNDLALSLPDNAPGLVGYFDTKKGFSLGLGLQSNDNSGEAVTDRLYGIAELDYYAPEFLFGREGNYRFWGRYNGEDRGRAFGLSFDQKFADRLTAFSRYGITGNTAPGEVEWTWSLGLGLESPFPSRKNDHTGLAFSQLKLPGGEKEEFMEVYYNFFITDRMALSLDSQVFLNSVGNGEDKTVDEDLLSAFGFRVQMDF